MQTRFAHLGLLLTFVFAAVAHADDKAADEKSEVQTALEQRIIDPQLPLRQIEDYTESHVPPMPMPTTVEEWERHVQRMREETFRKVIFRGEAAKWRTAKSNVEFLETMDGGPGYRITKLRFEAVPGLWIPALLYEPTELSGKVPVILNVNGHDRGDGKAADYKQIRCINQAKRGMIALNLEWVGMGQLGTPGFSHYKMNQIDLCGTSGIAVHYLSMSRGIDVLLSHENADPERVAVAGLSGGGWQTIFISSLDERVTLSDPVAGYSSFRTRARNHSDLGDSEQTPVDLATTADYAQLTAMRAPRPTLLTFNAQDQCCFKASHALPPLLDAARPIFRLYGKGDYLHWHINEDPGSHNFGQDNRQALYAMFGEYFFPNDDRYDPTEISSDGEVKSKENLHVEVPEGNDDFHTLALALSKDLPRNDVPAAADALATWQNENRKLLRETVRAKDFTAKFEQVGEAETSFGKAIRWNVQISDRFMLPMTELVGKESKSTVILVADAGRAAAAEQAEELLKAGNRVLAVDPFYLGESKITSRDFLFGLLVSAIGDRPVGLQASQLAAVAREAAEKFGSKSVEMVAVGPRTSLMALVAASLEADAIGNLTLYDCFSSLHQIIEQDMSVNEAPDLFCFGLLEKFDIPQLTALAKPRSVEFRSTATDAK